MRLRAWAWLALTTSVWSSFLPAATRPRYGGTLTVELSNAPSILDLAAPPGRLSFSIAETLVRVDSHGVIGPQLALAWQHDPDNKRWRFSLRPKVTFQDGEPLNAASAEPALLAALKKKYGDVNVTADGQTLVIQFDRPVPDLLAALTRPETAIVRKSAANLLIGTGPFRLVSLEPGRRLTLAAFEDYWGGRPFLDSVVISLGAGTARADVFDIPVWLLAARRARGYSHLGLAAERADCIAGGQPTVHPLAGSFAGHRPRAPRQCAHPTPRRAGLWCFAAVAQRLCISISDRSRSCPRPAANISTASALD